MRTLEPSEPETGYRRTPPLEPEQVKELVDEVRRDGFETAAYLFLRDHLWSYGMPVLKDALRLGKMPRLLTEHHVMVAISAADKLALHTSIESRDALAVDTLLLGEQHFREELRNNKWKHGKGASIETYFVTGCLFQFPRAYRKWSAERTDRLARLYGLNPEPFADVQGSIDTANTVVAAETARALLAQTDPATRTIVSLLAAGYTQSEVGGLLGISERAVEGR